MSTDPSPCKATLLAEWKSCNHLARAEAWSDLYYRRFGRLAPGKSEAAAIGIDSNDAENVAQCDDWHTSGLAKHDAIMAVVSITELVERLQARIEDLEYP